MTTEELFAAVTVAGHDARIRRDEVQVKTCWFCGNDRWNLELNAEKGVFSCWACRDSGFDGSGRLDYILNRFLGMDVSIPVRHFTEKEVKPPPDRSKMIDEMGLVPAWKLESSMRYLAKRGLTAEDARSYAISVCNAPDHRFKGRLVFQLTDYWHRTPIGIVTRRFVGSDGPKYMHDVESKIAGYRHPDSKIHVVCEGVFDGIMIHKAGANAAMLLGGMGLSMKLELVEIWSSRVPDGEVILVCLDGEARDTTKHVLKRIQQLRRDAQAVLLPEKIDPAQLDPEVLRRLFDGMIHRE